MSRPASDCADAFVAHLKSLNLTRQKMEVLARGRLLVRRDIEQAYEGLYLDAFTSMEHFLEQLFLGLLTARWQLPVSKCVPRVIFRSPAVCRDVVIGGRPYVDWLPYEHTEKRAAAFFRNGLPFCSLQAADKDAIRKCYHIRNAIAHGSDHAKSQFEAKVLGNARLLPRERTPAGYLRSQFLSSPPVTRYEGLALDMANVALHLCH